MSLHVAIIRRVQPGRAAEFEARVGRFFERAAQSDATQGAYLLRPMQGRPGEYGILRTFPDQAAMDRFYASDLYRAWNEEVADLVVGDPERRPLHGMEAFFPSTAGPPAWKMAILTWIAVNPAVYLFANGVPRVFGKLPMLVELLVVNLFVVALLTWGLMPALVRLAGPWLAPPERASGDGG